MASGVLKAARRPRYGGELRVEMQAGNDVRLNSAIFETLLRFDEHGELQPCLATSWSHDAARKRWVFTARPDVMLHNGTLWAPKGGVIEVPDDKPLRDMARPANAIVVRGDDGSSIGTGPFKIARWEAEKSARLVAHDAYWGGRPFLDAMEVRLGRALRDQEADFEAGKTDVAEINVTDARRFRQKGLASTPPMETVALVFENPRVPDAAREALALSIDRVTINNVLLQKQGEVSAALLPRWLSGYSFLFPSVRNVARAKQLNSPPLSFPMSFAYDRQDAVLRPIAERIAVNAGEAGIVLRNAAGTGDVRLMRLPITSRDSLTALEDLAAALKLKASAAEPYEFEKELLSGYRVIPLVHLPQMWAVASTVRNWPRLADVWLDSREQPSREQP